MALCFRRWGRTPKLGAVIQILPFSLRKFISPADNPLMISDNDIVFGLMPLSTRFFPIVNWPLPSQPDRGGVPTNAAASVFAGQFSDIFVYAASEVLQAALTEIYRFKSAYEYACPGSFIWEVLPPSVLWKLDAIAQ